MPIITKPASIEKNVAASITLNKTQLASVSSVAADSYFSNSANWKSVSIHYKSSQGNQIEVIRFDATQASPSASFLVSDKARDIFEVKKIVITDFDFGSFTVERSQLPVADFDISFSGGSSAIGIPFQLHTEYEIVNPALNPTYLENQTELLWAPAARALSNISIGSINSGVANFDITFNLSNFSASDNGSGMGTQVGLYCTDVAPELMDISVLNSQPWDGNNKIQTLLYGNYAGTWRKAGMHGTTGAGYGPLGTELAYIDPATVIRIKQTGNTIEFYRNGNLFSTVDTSSSTFSCMYMYPFTYGSKHTVSSVVVADTNNYIQWVNPFPNAYNIEEDGGLTNGSARGSSSYLNAYDETNTFSGDFELVFNVGSLFDNDTAFGVVALSENSGFCGVLSVSGTGFVFLNNSNVASFGASLANKEFKLTRVGTTYSYYSDGVLIYSGEGIGLMIGEVRSVATLNAIGYGNGGILNSATYIK